MINDVMIKRHEWDGKHSLIMNSILALKKKRIHRHHFALKVNYQEGSWHD
jgi:hypothetical protein